MLSEKARISEYLIGIFEQLPSRNSVKKAIKKGEVYLNGDEADSGRWVNSGDEIQLMDLEEKLPRVFEFKMDVVFEDEYLAIVHKPAGLLVSGNQFRTLENALPFNVQKSTEPDALKYPKPVHRLDFQTSGLLVTAKTAKAHAELGKMFKERTIQKTYHAVVVGLTPESGVLEEDVNGQQAVTEFELVSSSPALQSGQISLLKLKPYTGRTHQIRIHTAGMGSPIVGDKIYGNKEKSIQHKGLFLSATGLDFTHPITQQPISLQLDIPYKFLSLMKRAKRRWLKFKEEE
ncbi:RluA family pseudouridine synthase [Flammeovirgaceae bacterium SG7u.111]|nr:RluA family pseudouridine synthase [Flammeovirgaceae bacterium SG7u.132]WPO36038.1 RluA family pseudouridine synthase [Flammeovirgaceae bacterium SG7u.111]